MTLPSRSDTIRFEVILNGNPLCVAGVDGYGVLSVAVDWVLRDPDRKPKGGTREEWSKQRLKYHVGGLRGNEDESLGWAYGNLNEGDEITIRVLGPGEFDEPPRVGEKIRV